MQSNPSARYACRARAAICLQHVAIDSDRILAQRTHIANVSQAAANQALNLHTAALAIACLALGAAISGSRQHGVFRRYPAQLRSAAPRRQAVLDGGSAQHARVAKLHQARTQGVFHNLARKRDRTHLVSSAAFCALDLYVIHECGSFRALYRSKLLE